MISGKRRAVCALAAAALFGAGGCAGTTMPAHNGTPPQELAPAVQRYPIKHVVVVIQENRTFDNFFAGFPGADAPTTGRTHDGRTIRLKPITFARVTLDHFYKAGKTAYNNGAMNGFDLIPFQPPFTKYTPYSRVERSLVKPYWDMAQQYVLADHMFPTEWGPSFTAHLNLVAGTTTVARGESVVDMPMLDGRVVAGGCDAPAGTVTSLITVDGRYLDQGGPFPCYSFPTLADVLDAGHVSWKWYGANWPGGKSLWNAFEAIRKVRYGPDWSRHIVNTNKQVLVDAAAGKLPAVSWVIPTMPDSDHPGAGKPYGPSWVSAVVNAIGTGPDWKSSAIVIVWDDWGGWYDNVAPPQLDYRGLGARVGCIVISPYAKAGYVDHTQYEFGSILRTIERIYGLPTLGTTDRRANVMFGAFDFSQTPRPFKVIQARYPARFFMDERPSNLDLDD